MTGQNDEIDGVDLRTLTTVTEYIEQLLADGVQDVPVDDLATTVRVLEDLVLAMVTTEGQLMAAIPSDHLGNPLPEGEAERRLWSTVHAFTDDLAIITGHLMRASRAAVEEVPC